jgi:hypothetical protein
MKSGLRRLTAQGAAAALVGVVALSGGTAAQAWTLGTQLGTMTADPAAGLDISSMVVSTSGVCTDAAATNVQVYIYGSGFPADGQAVTPNEPSSILPTNPAGGWDITFQNTLRHFADIQIPPAVLSGVYQLATVCRAPFGVVDYGDFVSSITFTDPTHYISGSAISTTTTLAATPTGTAVAGAPVTLTATVTPAAATGSVQFLDGAASLGTAPVAAGHAALTTSTLASGTHSLKAVFTPTAPAGATPSTSAAVPYTIAVAPPVLGTYPSALILPVGTVVTCPGGKKLSIPASQQGNAIYCQTGGAYLLVAEASAPKALVPPSLRGTGKVGSKLTLTPGVWSPNYSSRTLVWKRDGKVIAKQTGPTYVVKKTDKGHKISVTMTVHLAGHENGTATTAGVVSKAKVGGTVFQLSAQAAATLDGVAGDTTPVGVPVGSDIGCFKADFVGAATITTNWLVDGQAYSAPTAMTIPDKLVGHLLTCRTTATNAGGSTISDAVVKVGPGAALLAYVKPHVTGVAKVGKKLTAVVGKWNPSYAKAAFVWLRDGKVIKGATKATYVTKATDKKHKIAVRVTVTRTGWGTGTSTSAAVSIG